MSGRGDAYRTILIECLGVSPSEDVLVVTDPARRDIAEALAGRARELDVEAVVAEMSERRSSAAEPPPTVAAAMLACRVLIAPTSKSLSHTEARRAASEKGVRAATMPGITADMLERTMGADYDAIGRRSESVAAALSGGREVHVTSSEGTDVTFVIEGRVGIADGGDLSAPGAFGNLPAGEGFIAPVEGATHGRIVFDGARALYGEPLVAVIEDGYATRLEGDVGRHLHALFEPHGRDAFAVAELGIGTNEAARLTGNVLEDEKIMGTIHVAFGDNHSFGGNVRVASHMDFVVLAPTVTIDGHALLDDGRLLL